MKKVSPSFAPVSVSIVEWGVRGNSSQVPHRGALMSLDHRSVILGAVLSRAL